MDRAALEVDDNLANAYEARRRHLEVSDPHGISCYTNLTDGTIAGPTRPTVLGSFGSCVALRWRAAGPKALRY